MDEPASGLTHSEVDELGETITEIAARYERTLRGQGYRVAESKAGGEGS